VRVEAVEAGVETPFTVDFPNIVTGEVEVADTDAQG